MAEKMRLELEPIDSTSVDVLNQRMDTLKRSGTEAAESLSRDEQIVGSFTTTVNGAATGITKAAAAADGTGSGFASLRQSIIAGSYALQDFTSTSGDLGQKLNSITNNLPQLLVSLGGFGVALSIAGTAAVAVYRNWDSIAGLWETRNPFPKAARDVEGMKRELDRAKDSIEAMEKAGTANARQMERYNELRATTARLEKEIADEQERQQAIKKFVEARGEEQAGRARAFEEATAGRGAEYRAKIQEAYKKHFDAEIEGERVGTELRVQAFRQSNATEEEKAKFASQQWNAFAKTVNMIRRNDPAKAADDLIVELMRGEANAGKALKRLMDETGLVWDGLAERMEELNPQAKKKKEAIKEQQEKIDKEKLKQQEQTQREAKEELAGHLEKMKELGGVAQIAKGLAGESATKGIEGEARLDFIRRGVAEAMKGGLGVRGFQAPKGIDIGLETTITRAAAGYAREALAQEKKEATAEQKTQVKAGQKEEAEERKTLIANRARQVREQSEYFTGMKFGQEEAGGIAKRSVELQGKGISANQATLQAMNEALMAMAKLGNQAAQQALWARQMGRQFGQVAQRSEQGQPSALNSTYGPY